MTKAFLILYLVPILACNSGGGAEESSEDFQNWLHENRIKPNERLYDFDYRSAADMDLPFEEIRKAENGDTLMVSFRSTQPVGCPLIGDIEIGDGKVLLKFGQACDPDVSGILNEEADLIFTYKIKSASDLKDASFVIVGLSELMK
ncbi:MAG: hypothetical protein H6606_04550 [Flavobacteriales bacterium]|nr:hypothetical protein [Flavobacteriales bacterium]